MKRLRIILLPLLLITALAACSPGHLGSNEIAFLRDGHLWTIDPDGANAFQVTSSSTRVVGYGWSPNHQILVFRDLDESFAKTAAAKHISAQPVTDLIGDLPGTLNTIGIDGGSPIPLNFADPAIQHSNAWWSAIGNRLLYREELSTADNRQVSWFVSQNDQPVGIARKSLPTSFSIPSLAEGSNLAIENSEGGIFTTALDGTNLHYLVKDVLPGHPLSATLERVLWQPAHQNPGILYATAGTQDFSAPSSGVRLIFLDPSGQSTTLARCTCTQFTWSPNGNAVLYTTGSAYTIYQLGSNVSFTFSAEEGAVPYWSHDSQFLLFDGLHSLSLVQIASKHLDVLLSDTKTVSSGSVQAQSSQVNALFQPVSNSLWANDSRHFLFVSRGRMLWQGRHLSSGKGLYTVSIDDHGKPQGSPTIVDTGNDLQAGWTFEDANTSFLF